MRCLNSMCRGEHASLPPCGEIFAAEITALRPQLEECPRQELVCDGSGPEVAVSPSGRLDKVRQAPAGARR
jgi:hypothetical protein